MEQKELAEYVDQQRWLLNNGLLNDAMKNQLFMYGSIVHKDVQAVELEVNVAEKHIDYKIFVPKALLNKIETYKELSTSTGLIGMWRFRRMLRNGDNLNFDHILRKFVKDFCGPNWNATIEVLDIANYAEGFETAENGPDGPPIDKQPDGR